MSSYQHKLDIVSRTLKILKENNSTENEKTLFLNCCLGLLILPQQEGKRNNSITVNGTVSYDEWGIDPESIEGPKKSSDLAEIVRHFRNSLSHNRFDIVDCNPGKTVENICVRDFDEDNSETPNFELILQFKDFERFVLKYAEELESKLKSI